MSEDAKLSSLRERINEVARNEGSLLIIPMGVFIVSAGLVISVIGNNTLAYIGGSSIALGVFSIMFGFFGLVQYADQHNSLLRELHKAQFVKEAIRK